MKNPWWTEPSVSDDIPDGPSDSNPDEERGPDWFEYQLQCSFEDLCGLIGFNRATESVMRILREHMEMLKRQGKQ